MIRDPLTWILLASFAAGVAFWCYRVLSWLLLRRTHERLQRVTARLPAHATTKPHWSALTLSKQHDHIRRLLRQVGLVQDTAYAYTLSSCAMTAALATLLAAGVMAQTFSFQGTRTGWMALAVVLGSAALGGALPLWILRRWAKQAQRHAQKHFANALDLLGMCMLAGMNLQQALDRITPLLATQSRVLAQAFTAVSLMLKVGAPPERALSELESFLAMPDIRTLIGHLVQAGHLGTPMSSILTQHAHDIRWRQQLQAQTQSGKIRTWLILPLVFCQMPALLAIMIGPSVLVTLRMLENMAQ